MYKDQIYEEENFKTKYKSAYNQTLEEAKSKGINLNEYYFSQYLTTALSNTETLGMATYILDDDTDDISFYVEILFNSKGEIIKTSSEKDEDEDEDDF